MDYTLFFINHDGDVFSFGDGKFRGNGHKGKTILSPTMIPTLKHIIFVSVGFYHTVCLDYDGNVFSFGRNIYGQLGIGNDNTVNVLENGANEPQKVNIPPCKEISCGTNFTVCLTDDGMVYSFGYNSFGQLGLGNTDLCYFSPQLISSLKDVEWWKQCIL